MIIWLIDFFFGIIPDRVYYCGSCERKLDSTDTEYYCIDCGFGNDKEGEAAVCNECADFLDGE
jgi:DNA-directed RNA polymerase subunit RPC12/RpoP